MEAGWEEVHGGRTDESCHEQVVGVIVKLLWGVDLQQFAPIDDRNACCHCHGFHLIVGDVDERGLQAMMQFVDLGSHLDPELGVQVREWFIKQEDLRLADNGASHCHPLALSAGELARFALQQVRDAEHFSGLVHSSIDLIFWGFLQSETKCHVLIYREVGIQGIGLEDHGNIAVFGGDFVDYAVADQILRRR